MCDPVEEVDIPIKLKSAKDYPAWRAYMSNACWVASQGKEMGELKPSDCEPNEKGEYPLWLRTCWGLIVRSLDDTVMLRVTHVKKGRIPELLEEIYWAVMGP